MSDVLRAVLAALLIFWTLPLLAAEKPIPIVLDTDIGTDVDDAYALVLAARSPQLDLRAVTTVHAKVAVRAAIAKKLLVLMGRDHVAVAPGRAQALNGQEGLWGGWEGKGLLDPKEEVPGVAGQEAPKLLADLIASSKEKITVVSVGGLTNIAVALQQRSAIKDNIERIVIMGGCVHPILILGKRIPDRMETNLHSDVDAAAEVLRSGLPITLVPAEVTFPTKLLRSDFARIQESRAPLALAMTRMTKVWEPFVQGFAKNSGIGAYYEDGVVMLHDPLAVAALVDPTMVKIERQPIRVEVTKNSIRTVPDPQSPIVVDLLVSADVRRLSHLVTARVLGEE